MLNNQNLKDVNRGYYHRFAVLCHGMFSDSSRWKATKSMLESQGYTVVLVDWDSNDLSENIASQKLETALKAKKSYPYFSSDPGTIYIGHSNGGRALADLSTDGKINGTIIAINAPFLHSKDLRNGNIHFIDSMGDILNPGQYLTRDSMTNRAFIPGTHFGETQAQLNEINKILRK